ncbi:rhomboid family intramembrane serine protease [Deinococcota bacterium DY0809b]
MFPLADINRPLRPPLVVKALVALNAAVFLVELLAGPAAREAMIYTYGFVPRLFWADPLGEGYRLVTSQFLHGGFSHILGNLWFLWVFGDNVEDRLGRFRFLVFYLLGGALAALAQGVFDPGSTRPMIGASGSISAVLGAYFVLFPRAQILTLVWIILPLTFYLPAAFYLGYWALLQFFYALLGGSNVAFWAHLGGFVWGWAALRYGLFAPAAPPWRRG